MMTSITKIDQSHTWYDFYIFCNTIYAKNSLCFILILLISVLKITI